MVKIKSITHKHYRGKIFDITLQNETSPYFYANDILTHNSLYPHLMIQANLYGRCKDTTIERPVWNGNNVWKVEGNYFSDKLAPVGELLSKWYHDRVEYKKINDRREYTIKIIINTVYGLLDHPYYTLVYDKIAAGDCTRLGRQFIKYARKRFVENNFNIIENESAIIPVIIGDTDRAMFTWRKLFDNGVYVNAFIPPGVPPNMSMMRTSYMATHKKEHLDEIVDIFVKIGTELGYILK